MASKMKKIIYTLEDIVNIPKKEEWENSKKESD